MKCGHVTQLVALTLLVLAIHVRPTESIKGGAPASKCDFPGLAVMVDSSGAVLCTGIRVNLDVIFPLKCRFVIGGKSFMGNWQIKSSGFQWNFPQGFDPNTSGQTRADGTFQLPLETGSTRVVDADEPVGQSCFPGTDATANFNLISTAGYNGVLYDGSEDLDSNTCVMAGYGSTTNSGAQYSAANLQSAPITQSMSAPCCDAVSSTLTEEEQGVGVFSLGYPFNCVVSSGAPCGLADLGDPVMCQTTSGKLVTIGLVGSAPCVDNGLFLIHDLTGSSTKTKFGVPTIA